MEEELTMSAAIHCLAATTTMETLLQHEDQEYATLKAHIQNTNRPPKNSTTAPYRRICYDLSIADNGLILLKAGRIVISNNQRKANLQSLHGFHAGITRTTKMANQLCYWPGMTEDIKNMINTCRPCQELRPAQPRNPPKLTPVTNTVPMHNVGTDLYSLDKEDHLVLVDRHSGFVMSKLLTKTSTTAIINQLNIWFNLLGWSQTIWSDRGQQYHTEFDQFCKRHNIKHKLMSPHNPEANGLAERAVKSTKHLLIKCKETNQDFQTALACY